MENKFKKSGIVGDLINGIGGLIILVIITLVIISTLLGANLLDNSVDSLNFSNTTNALAGNFTSGIDEVSEKIPTILLIAAVVLLFGVLVLLVARSRQMGIGGGGSL